MQSMCFVVSKDWCSFQGKVTRGILLVINSCKHEVHYLLLVVDLQLYIPFRQQSAHRSGDFN